MEERSRIETYENYVKDVFVEHHIAMGMDVEEAEDFFNENEFSQMEKWLTKIGYDLKEIIIKR